jgi:hypothetical protein
MSPEPEAQALPCVLTAYRLPRCASYPKIVPASASREWMDGETSGWANRCLPLRIANQSGWMVLNDADFEAAWAGKPGKDSVRISFDDGQESTSVSSLFGYGVLTFGLPYLFRTPAGWNLSARGPANVVKDGIAPLEGVVETDWLTFPFTMNWKFTRRLKSVRFKRDEPICMLVPVRRGDSEAFRPEIRNLASDPEALDKFELWLSKRHEVRTELAEETKSIEGKKLGHYNRGEGYLGERSDAHQRRLEIQPFAELDPAPAWENPATPTPVNFWRRLLRR